MKFSLAAFVATTLAGSALLTPAADFAAERHLVRHDYCAGSPLTIGAPYSRGGRIASIAVVAGSDERPVGWAYRDDRGRRTIQANPRMSSDDRAALALAARARLSNLHPWPASLPSDLHVRPCRPTEIARY